MSLSKLTEAERAVVYECLSCVARGNIIQHDQEFSSLFGLQVGEYLALYAQWSNIDDTQESVALAINGAMNNLLGYPHAYHDRWHDGMQTPRAEVERVFAKWRGNPTRQNVGVMNELKRISDTRNVPADLAITYDDMHGLWGGTTITIRGDGHMERRTQQIGVVEVDVTQTQIDKPALLELIDLLISLAAWDQVTPDDMLIPDESRANLAISVNGYTSNMWERVNETVANNRLIQVKNRLEGL